MFVDIKIQHYQDVDSSQIGAHMQCNLNQNLNILFLDINKLTLKFRRRWNDQE